APTRHASSPPLFPYTTLFRSRSPAKSSRCLACRSTRPQPLLRRSRRNPLNPRAYRAAPCALSFSPCRQCCELAARRATSTVDRRSEEHTSELQSRENLVCRLL